MQRKLAQRPKETKNRKILVFASPLWNRKGSFPPIFWLSGCLCSVDGRGLCKPKKQKHQGNKGGLFSLSGPVLRDTASLSQRYPHIARHGVFGVSTWPIGCNTPSPFSERSPLESMRSGGAIPPPPPQKGYLSDTRAITHENNLVTLTALSLFKAVVTALFKAAGPRKLTPQILVSAFKERHVVRF